MPGVTENEAAVQRKKSKKEAKEVKEVDMAEGNEQKTTKKRKNDSNAEDVPKQKKLKSSDEATDSDSENPLSVTNFRISEPVKQVLSSKGIKALFPIQAQTFEIVFGGDDLVARARTGQGKTFAFVLPIVESVAKAGVKKTYGRAPVVLVLAPTRELAKQVHADFEVCAAAVGLNTVCVYGGSQYGPQQSAMKRGVDIVVGTPGRIKDFIDRGDLDFKTLKFRVLDEADEMLNMGFKDDVEYILGAVEDASTVQTLLFSATMPVWVKEIARNFLKPEKKTVDLVGDEKMKASTSVKHLLLPCAFGARSQIVADIIKVYGSGGKSIVFTETKNDASELAALLGPQLSRALHGDIPQTQREATLAGFRSGKFSVLVATDVAARGLDINDVQVIVQSEPPKDVETYIHRSGRTGRAGNTGTAVMLYDRRKEYMIPMIESKAGFKFERISAPKPSDIAKESATFASENVSGVSDSVIPLFKEAAEELIKSSGLSAVDALAKALAKIAGYTEVKRRSLQTSHDDATTLLFVASKEIYSAGYIFNALRNTLPEECVSEIRRLNLAVDGKSAVFDVPTRLLDDFLNGPESHSYTLSVAETLPELTQKPTYQNNGGRDMNRNNSRGGYGGRGGRTNRGRGGGRGRWSR